MHHEEVWTPQAQLGFDACRTRRAEPVCTGCIAQQLGGCKTLLVATALYPGSFDPFHLGHLNVVEQVARIFDEVVVGVLGNPRKPSGLFTLDDRVRLVEAATAHLTNVRCVSSDKLTIDMAACEGAVVLVRSGHKDARHESTMAATNEQMSGIQTLFAAADPNLRTISSSLVRDLMSRGHTGDAARLVPPPVGRALEGLVNGAFA